MLVQELDQSLAHQRTLASMAQKLDSEVAVLERSGGPGSVPPSTTAGISTGLTKSPRTGRKRRGNRRDQQNSDRVTNLAGSVVRDVVVSTLEQRASASSSVPVHSVPLLSMAGFMPPFSAPHSSHAVGGIHAGLVNLAPVTSVGGARMPSIRFVNGDDSPARFPKHCAPGVGAGGLHLSRGRQDSSSSTDSAETVRHLEHGTCVGDIDRYLKASAMMQSSAGAGPVHQTFATPSAVSSSPGMRVYFRPALLSGVSFPASRSELEQYKQVLHGSAHVPPTEASTISTPKSQAPRVRQRSPGRGRGRKAATVGTDSSASRNVVPMVTTTSMPRFFSVGMVPPSMPMPVVRGAAPPAVTAVHGMLRLVCVAITVLRGFRVHFTTAANHC